MEQQATNKRKYIPWFLGIAFIYTMLLFIMQFAYGEFKYYTEDLSSLQSIVFLALPAIACILMLLAYLKRSKKLILLAALMLIVRGVISETIIYTFAVTLLLLFFAILELDDQDISDNSIYNRSKDLKLYAIYLFACFYIIIQIFFSLYYLTDDILGLVLFVLKISWWIVILILVRRAFKKQCKKALLVAIILISTTWIPNLFDYIMDYISYGDDPYYMDDNYILHIFNEILSTLLNPTLTLSIITYLQFKKIEKMDEASITYTPEVFTKWFIIGSRKKVVRNTLIIIFIIPIMTFFIEVVMDSVGW